MILIDQWLMTMFLCSKGAGNILAAVHNAAALIVEAKDAWHHVRAAFRSFESRRTFLGVADPARL